MLDKNKKLILILIGPIAVIAIALVAYSIRTSNSPSSKSGQNQIQNNPEDTTQEEIDTSADATVKKTDESSTVNEDPSNDTKKVIITRATVSDSTLTVSAIVENAQNSDVCTLILSKSGEQDLTYTNNVVFQTSYYSCKNFIISKDDIPSTGTWSIKVFINKYEQGQSGETTISI